MREQEREEEEMDEEGRLINPIKNEKCYQNVMLSNEIL